jgi:hypothetical protein
MKKSDIIKVLKPQGFVKAKGIVVSREAWKQVTNYDRNTLSYYIAKADNYSLVIEQIHNKENYDADYLNKIEKVLLDADFVVNNDGGYLLVKQK